MVDKTKIKEKQNDVQMYWCKEQSSSVMGTMRTYYQKSNLNNKQRNIDTNNKPKTLTSSQSNNCFLLYDDCIETVFHCQFILNVRVFYYRFQDSIVG